MIQYLQFEEVIENDMIYLSIINRSWNKSLLKVYDLVELEIVAPTPDKRKSFSTDTAENECPEQHT